MVNLIISIMIAVASLVIPAEILPPCAEEDGFGVAVCQWDGVVSGDCAPEYVGGILESALCIQKHSYDPKNVEKCVESYNMDELFDFNRCIALIP